MVLITEASSSSSSNTLFDVFISFRGVDTRLSFVDHLHNALLDANLTTFFDEAEIDTGEDLRPELERAIKASRASIIVLSPNYAFSTWCLDELVLILEQRLAYDQLVIPIFYHVEPTYVRKQEGSFGDAMAVHQKKMEEETNDEKRSQWAMKIDRWKKALTEVAQLKGKDARGRKETEFIAEIVTNIHQRLGRHLQNALPILFGMEDSIEFITSWLEDGSSHTADILTICGMGGIGKTSLARYIHGLYYRSFPKSSFIECISEKCVVARVSGLRDVQKQLFGDISKASQIQVHDILVYTTMIENGLTRKKVFIILDNIDSVDQLHALLGKKGFYPGSKIIITTKDASLIERYAPINLLVKPKHTKLLLGRLHKKASLQLFSQHAFMSNYPNDGYEEVSEQIMAYCKGHPLALKVLGESLCNKTVAEWEDCIMGLKEESDSRIMNVLKTSFDSIQSNNDKELFKHIACFFVQKDRVFAETILNSCGIRTTGITNLIDRCLLTVRPDNMLIMHQLIQEMGRDVVRQESPDKPEERSRLWCHEESFSVLEENKGTRFVKGLVLDMKLLEIDMLCGSVELETSALSKMPNLMLLQLNYVQLNGSYKNFPKKLRWLCMHGFPLKCVPLDLPMENLVDLDMSYSNIEYFDVSYNHPQPPAKRQKVTESCSKFTRLLGSLKFLTLSFSEQLRRIGGFSELPALQRLIVNKCICLMEICESIDQSVELVYIDLSFCKKLKKVPETIGSLKKVETLLLDGCDLLELPMKKRDVDSSKAFKAEVVHINSQSSSCAMVEAVQNDSKFFAISLPSSLTRLSLANANLSNKSFPLDFICLSMLKDLCLDGNPIISLPNCVRTLPRLETLSMSNCLKLKSVEHPPCTLRQLNLYNNCWKPHYKNLLRKIAFDREMAPLELIADKNLLAPSSFEIEGMVKIQPMAGVEKKVLRCLGWKMSQFNEDRCMVTNCNYGGPEESQIQMYYEFGIFSTIYKGVWMPMGSIWDIISYEPSISFTIPSSPTKVRGLNFCCVGSLFELPMIKLSNITKKLTWIYKHCIESFSVVGGSLVFLSHWMFGMNEMEVGDEISINIEKHIRYTIYECGMNLLYDDGSMYVLEYPLGYYQSWNHIIGGDLSAFQLTTGEYFLSSADFLRSLFSSFFYNAHYKEKTVSFSAFSQGSPTYLVTPKDVSSYPKIEVDVVDVIPDHPWLQFELGTIEHAKCSKFVQMKIGRQKAVDWEVMAELGERDRLAGIIGDDTPWSRLFKNAFLPSYRELTVEFLSTFTYIRPHEMEEDDERSEISFRLCGHPHQMSIKQFGVLSGLYYESETVTPQFAKGITEIEESRLTDWWPQIAKGPFHRTNGRVTSIRYPHIRYLHQTISTSITGRGKSREWCTIHDLFYLYCLLTGTRCNLARCLAEYFASYYQRQKRGAVYGGAYITLIAQAFSYLPRHLGDVSPPIEPARLDRHTFFGMRIIPKYPGDIRWFIRP